jgi:hypothetical protein
MSLISAPLTGIFRRVSEYRRNLLWVKCSSVARAPLTAREQDAILSISIREAVAAFLEEQDETVAQSAYERIAAVLGEFLQYLDAKGVTEPSCLDIEHVEEFLTAASRSVESSSDAWHSVKAFVTWLGRRKYARALSKEFASRQNALREMLKTVSKTK